MGLQWEPQKDQDNLWSETMVGPQGNSVIVLETDMMMKRNQGSTEEITIQVNKTVTKQPEKLEEPEGETRKTDSLKEPRTTNVQDRGQS